MNYSPMSLYLSDLKKKLATLNMPVFFELPNASQVEPFAVIGAVASDSGLTAQTGRMIENVSVHINLFLKGNSRTAAEEMRAKAIRLLGHHNRITSRVNRDNSIGRDVYNIVIDINEIII